MLYEFGGGDKEELRSEARERKKWSIEFRNSGLEESYQFGVPFFCFFSSLLFSILYYFIGSRPGINGVGSGFTTSGFQSMGGGVSPCAESTERILYGANW
jgi:hypothetical protein